MRCSECDWAISSTPHTIPALDHDWGDWDTTDATNHTRVCSRDSSHVDTEAHAFSNWSKNIPQDETLIEKMKKDYDPSAQCFRYCNVCYRIEYSDHNYVGAETTPATCEGTGVKTYTCSICNDSYTETIPAKGHDYKEKTNPPVDAHIGFEYFECSACHKLRQAAYNGSTYVPDETKPEYAPDALSSLVEAVESDPTNTSIVPASTFNNFVDQTIPIGGGNYYNYSERGSGLRLMRNEETGAVDYSFNTDLTTIQDMRFSGAATLPTGVSISVNPAYRDYSEEDLKDAHVDNCLVDFGYIYTQDDYMIKHGGFEALKIENTDTEEHPGTKFARMSVPSNNDTSGTYNPTADNWTGVTYHSGSRQLTFNLVIRIKAKNWTYFYSCRPYMRYMYHGHLYTVYDEVAFGPTYSCAMVYYVADDMVRAHDPLTEYATRKIINNYDYLPDGDLK